MSYSRKISTSFAVNKIAIWRRDKVLNCNYLSLKLSTTAVSSCSFSAFH